ncbi:MAG: triose-phosphate isomerase [Candidatus Pacebacteria bacterium]|nr:triose-phosphate isomerase [Candidatus Paceibacterota bacterium]
MQTKKIVIGNWKMNPANTKEALRVFGGIQKSALKIKQTEVVICAPFVYLEKLKKISRKVKLGAQNAYPGDTGAITGEVSVSMLSGLAAKYVILGHSERRALGESNADVNKKIKSILSKDITPILCVGERDRDPEHSYLGFVKTQVEECLDGVSKNILNKVVIAYEPIWAIGKNAERPATPAEYLEMSIFIRKVLNDKFGAKSIDGMRIIYGGSTNPENALSFLIDGKADGFLVGRDSLDPVKFASIINKTENAKY